MLEEDTFGQPRSMEMTSAVFVMGRRCFRRCHLGGYQTMVDPDGRCESYQDFMYRHLVPRQRVFTGEGWARIKSVPPERLIPTNFAIVSAPWATIR